MTRSRRTGTALPITLLAAAGLLIAACSGGSDSVGGDVDGLGDPGNCTVVEAAVSPEKIDLMRELAAGFNGSAAAEIEGGCAFVRPYSKSSGAAADALVAGWDDEGAEGTRPTIWSPAASSWGAIVEQRRSVAGDAPITGGDAPSFMLTPLVIAMPKPMADALGYPEEEIGWGDLADLAADPEGWAAHGHPEWGSFKLGKTNPNFSTSGLSALIGQNYAAAGKTRGLSREDLASAGVVERNIEVESSVVHYGDITMTFLDNWFRTDRAGTSLTYVSAVAVEEKSVIDYNAGNPDGVLERGERPTPPRVPLVAIYPEEGTLYSDNPLYTLDAPWVDDRMAAGAAAFIEHVQIPENQEKVLEFGFRPGNPDVAIGAPITPANGVDPDRPSTLLQVPEPAVMVEILENWKEQRRDARVMIVMDVSGSMQEPATSDPNGPTKLDLAVQAAVGSIDEFKDTDQVGLRTFTTQIDGERSFLDVMPVQPMGTHRERLKNDIRAQIPLAGTPLYEVTSATHAQMIDEYDDERINAIVLLTDGMNDDGNRSDDDAQLRDLLAELEAANGTESEKPIRIFPIAYGEDADADVLTRIAEATNAAMYEATDPETIVKVFTAVISNF